MPGVSFDCRRSLCSDAGRSESRGADDRCFVKAYIRKQLTSNTITNVIIRNSAGPLFHPLCSLDLDALNFGGSSLQTVVVTPVDLTHHYILTFPVAVCDGLMLIAPKPERKWQIWNPTTHESLNKPQGDFDSLKHVATGLGFDESTDDYKAVVIDSRSRGREYVYRTHVYSLKSDSWRTITNFSWHDMWGPKGPGVFMCGSLNWFLSPYQNYERIIALDLGTETYRELKVSSLPDRPFI